MTQNYLNTMTATIKDVMQDAINKMLAQYLNPEWTSDQYIEIVYDLENGSAPYLQYAGLFDRLHQHNIEMQAGSGTNSMILYFKTEADLNAAKLLM